MKNGAIIVKDIEDTKYVFGVLILNGKSINVDIFEERVSDMFKELCWNEEEQTFNYDEYDAEAVINEVINRYADYEGMVYINDVNEAYV